MKPPSFFVVYSDDDDDDDDVDGDYDLREEMTLDVSFPRLFLGCHPGV